MGLSTTSAADPVARAQLLARIRDAVLSGAPVPQQPRPVVSESWRRSLAARVDPERGAGPPAVFDSRDVADLRAEHPLAETLPLLRETLVATADEALHMMVVTDEHGHILWREGQSGVLTTADKVGLIEGTRWSEDAMGTNAMGTALAENLAVQIHSAEHLVRAYSVWTCAACPVHDPDTGRIIGVVDVTGPVHSFHPSTMALVKAAARLAEGQLRARMAARDELLRTRCAPQLAALGGEYGALVTRSGRVLASEPHNWLPTPRLELPGENGTVTLPNGQVAVLEELGEGYLLRSGRRRTPLVTTAAAHLELRFLGHAPIAELNGRRIRLTQRHADMLTLLALHPDGVSAEQLATGVYGERGNPVTARAEVHRLRAQLGAAVVRSSPYRLQADLTADWLQVRSELLAGEVRSAASRYRGELRPGSEAPAVTEERELLAATIRRAVLDSGDAEAMWLVAETDTGADDLELAERLAASLPLSDPRHATITARADRLTS
ncbi:GAF domain-containing protein [Pseudonocardia spinosispora]|uniref:GAF domain-containing protein n=1 Tax=Pseudonocardia spinosispora TaxID=103441 RepID=UPI000423C740|nr:helix-turn-helix domain-containing protein [Pseudonocardia spinosispora]